MSRPHRQKRPQYLFWDFAGYGGQLAIRMGRWKGIKQNVRKNPDAPPELYDLGADPGEQHDLLAAEPHEAQRLRVRLAELLESLPEAEGAVTTLTEDEVRKLRSLGYVK